MDTPNLLKGFLYPSSRACRCPRFHACLLTHKCQSYDPHQLDCQVCETRVVGVPVEPGGVVPEGMYTPDLQDAYKTMEEAVATPVHQLDREQQKIDGVDITRKWEKIRKAADLFKYWQFTSGAKLSEDVVEHLALGKDGKLLGAMD